MRVHVFLSAIVVVLANVTLAALARGEDFRIETLMFAGKEKTAASQTLTLFRSGIVYDYLSGPDKVAVFDKAHGRFVLLDPARRVKTEIKTAEVLVFSGKLQAWAEEASNKFLKFAARPEFDSKFDEESDELSLTSNYWTYEVRTVKARDHEAAQQYREFSDWYARLNAMTNPGSYPPFPRLALNEHLAERDLVPTRVRLIIPQQVVLQGSGLDLRTEHKVSWRLLERDLDKIAETANQLTAFRAVPFEDYRAPAVSKR